MSKHTPGPWSTCCLDRCPHHVYGSNHDEVICDLLHNEPNCYGYDKYSGIVTIDQRQANARLIAAAPDLLEALENLENDDNSIPSHAWDMMQSAIAKAKGETK